MSLGGFDSNTVVSEKRWQMGCMQDGRNENPYLSLSYIERVTASKNDADTLRNRALVG